MPETKPAIVCSIPEVRSLLDLHLGALRENPGCARDIPPLMLWGPPGVGKSAVVRDTCRQHGIGFVDIHLSQREPVDLRGLPVPRGDSVTWLLSSEWPRDPDSRGIILFDELTAADRTLQAAAYELILDRRLGDLYTVPPGWYIVAAGNRLGDYAVATSLSSALANRFCHVEVEADLEGWVGWALQAGIHPDVIGFLRYRPQCLFDMTGDTERGWPSPRSWVRVAAELALIERGTLPPDSRARLLAVVATGLVGQGAALEFLAFRTLAATLPDAGSMLEGKVPVTVPARADQRYALCAALAHHLRRRTDWRQLVGAFLRIGLALPSDFAALALVDALRDRPAAEMLAVTGHPLFAAWSRLHGGAVAAGLCGGAAALADAALAAAGLPLAGAAE
jgi:hypothetical protein